MPALLETSSSISPMSEDMRDCLQSQLPNLPSHCQFKTVLQSTGTILQPTGAVPQLTGMVPQPTGTVPQAVGAVQQHIAGNSEHAERTPPAVETIPRSATDGLHSWKRRRKKRNKQAQVKVRRQAWMRRKKKHQEKLPVGRSAPLISASGGQRTRSFHNHNEWPPIKKARGGANEQLPRNLRSRKIWGRQCCGTEFADLSLLRKQKERKLRRRREKKSCKIQTNWIYCRKAK